MVPTRPLGTSRTPPGHASRQLLPIRPVVMACVVMADAQVELGDLTLTPFTLTSLHPDLFGQVPNAITNMLS